MADGTGLIVEVPIDEGLVSLGQAIPPQLAAEIEAACDHVAGRSSHTDRRAARALRSLVAAAAPRGLRDDPQVIGCRLSSVASSRPGARMGCPNTVAVSPACGRFGSNWACEDKARSVPSLEVARGAQLRPCFG